MTRWALIDNGTVANVIEQDGQPQAAGLWVACGAAGPGWSYDGTLFSPPWVPSEYPTWASPSLDHRYHWLDTGPWRDRFGVDWLAITSSDNALCKACAQLYLDRKYVDLKDARNAQILDALIATAQPAANPLLPGSGPITPAKKAVILNQQTTDYERHIKGLPQPI